MHSNALNNTDSTWDQRRFNKSVGETDEREKWEHKVQTRSERAIELAHAHTTWAPLEVSR